MKNAEFVIKVFPTQAGFVWKGVRQHEGIRIIDDALSRRQMAELMRSCDVLVAPSRAEGFGMPVLEAMSCGLPVIVPNGCAMDDFCPEEARYSVEADLVRVFARPRDRLPRYTWVEPRLLALRRAMRRCFEQRSELREKGNNAVEAARNFSWETVTRMAVIKGSTAAGLT